MARGLNSASSPSYPFGDLAVLFRERPDVRVGEDFENNNLRGAAQADAFRRHNNRPISQDGMGDHEVDQFVIRPFRVASSGR